MATTVPLTDNQLCDFITWLLNEPEAKGKAYRIRGKAYAAIAALIYLTGARISEVIDLRINQIADDSLNLHPHIQMLKLKTRRKYETLNIDDEDIRKHALKILVDEGVINDTSEFELKAKIIPLRIAKKTKRTIKIDTTCSLARVVENWLKLDRSEQGHINPNGYAFTLGLGSASKRITRRSAYKAFQKAYIALSLAYVSRGCHCLRKSAALKKLEVANEIYNGDAYSALKFVQQFLGHENINTTTKYLPLSEADETDIAIKHAAKINLGAI